MGPDWFRRLLSIGQSEDCWAFSETCRNKGFVKHLLTKKKILEILESRGSYLIDFGNCIKEMVTASRQSPWKWNHGINTSKSLCNLRLMAKKLKQLSNCFKMWNAVRMCCTVTGPIFLSSTGLPIKTSTRVRNAI